MGHAGRFADGDDRLRTQSALGGAVDEMISQRARTIAEFRAAFGLHGFDVSHYTDDQICRAILTDRDKDTCASGRERLSRVFQRIRSAA